MAANRQRDTFKAAPNLAGAAAGSERRQGFRAVGVAASRLAAPVVARRGGGILIRLKSEWTAIVGNGWAAVAWPTALGRDGVLKLRTAPAAALELQHRAPLLIERINLYFGRPVVTRLTQVQGPLPLPAAPAAPPPPTLTAGEAAALEARLSGIADPELRAVLARLGRAVIGARR